MKINSISRTLADDNLSFFDFHLNPMRAFDGDGSTRVDIIDTDKAVIIHADMPGYQRDSIEIETHDGYLIINGQRNLPKADGRFIMRERHSESFRRKFRLSDKINSDDITAKLNDGVLTITIGKRADLQPRRISIGASGES